MKTYIAHDRRFDLTWSFANMEVREATEKAGIFAGFTKVDCDLLHGAILDLAHDVRKQNLLALEKWKKSRLNVIFKKGDTKLTGN